jgi:hypothetical protein
MAVSFENKSVEQFVREARDMAQPGYHPPVPGSFKERVQLGRLSITHDAIMDWLLANPGKGQMAKCALHFGFTRSWLSSIVWSDAFQAKLRDKKEALFSETVVPMRDQMNGVAQRALERLGEKVEVIDDPKILTDVADKMLHRLGYAPKVDHSPGTQNNTQNNFYAVSPELLAAARANAKKGDLDGTSEPALPAPEGVQAQLEHTVGETLEGSAELRHEEEEAVQEGCEVPRAEV